ncbi:hypothetical protein [Desulfoluna sp.]|uniref:hypothetical protein n=1 Tax=Desulfoluna sp. TaxID=2045199 RepID=UPI0026392A01|nr:hypothetical protein [Desulfoluna sp.]
MKKTTAAHSRIVSTLLVLCAITLCSTQASAGMMDFMFGRVAHEGSELYDLAMVSLNQNGGETTYFTNGEGRILDVQAKKCTDGRVRASVQRVFIPKNYVAGSLDGTLAIEATCSRLHELAQQGEKVGEYTLIPATEGAEAFSCGEAIALALDSE